MIDTYSNYINRYILKKGLDGAKSPGEHHFVSAYLIPKLFAINKLVPDYINPDGTKEIIGDVVYFNNGSHHFGIEVKYETIRLTKNEYNAWIVSKKTSLHPKTFIGIGSNGIIVLPWHEFRKDYLTSVKITVPKKINSGYGPQKSINVMFDNNKNGYLPYSKNKGKENEAKFIKLLQDEINR